VDGQIVTQTVLLWADETRTATIKARHSVVIVCSRFSRRLQAALQALAHQQGPKPGDLEVIVAYVPGIDATDDVLDSLQAVYPALTLRRIPFAPDRLRAKGFLINECTALVSGEWVTLLDADILLPPDYVARLDALDTDIVFAAPEGRHMLDAPTTARILLGEIRPWDHYNELRQQAAEYRHHESDGVPPGFCQSVRRRVFDSVRYEELDHFEGSDWWFSRRVMDQFGPVWRLDGMAVLHLDHGGSQWYGTGKQR
jgi:glycosyltransferase involved in cell wall biosynthesis